MVVRDPSGSHLPVAADAQELAVERKESLVGTERHLFVLSAGGEPGPCRVSDAALGGDADSPRRVHDEATVEEGRDDLGLVDLDDAA